MQELIEAMKSQQAPDGSVTFNAAQLEKIINVLRITQTLIDQQQVVIQMVKERIPTREVNG